MPIFQHIMFVIQLTHTAPIAQYVFGKIFMPLAWVLGVSWNECDKVGELIALKSIINEFVAYERLADMLGKCQLSVSHYVPYYC